MAEPRFAIAADDANDEVRRQVHGVEDDDDAELVILERPEGGISKDQSYNSQAPSDSHQRSRNMGSDLKSRCSQSICSQNRGRPYNFEGFLCSSFRAVLDDRGTLRMRCAQCAGFGWSVGPASLILILFWFVLFFFTMRR